MTWIPDAPYESNTESAGRVQALLSSGEGRQSLLDALRAAKKTIPVEEMGLSVRAYHCMKRLKIDDFSGVLALYPDGYLQIRSAGAKTVGELRCAVETTVQQLLPLVDAFLSGADLGAFAPEKPPEAPLAQRFAEAEIGDLLTRADTRARLDALAAQKDESVERLGLSVRAINALRLAGVQTIPALLAYYPDGFFTLKNAGRKTGEELKAAAESYAEALRQELLLYGNLPGTADAAPQSIPEPMHRRLVTDCFRGLGFQGLHYEDIRAHCPDAVPDAELKRVIGALLREGALEYVDFRLYRRYPSVLTWIAQTDRLSERERELLQRRIAGETLDAVGQRFGVTRERVRQIEAKAVRAMRTALESSEDPERFDEEYYTRLFTAYDVPAAFWAEYSGALAHVRPFLSLLFEKGAQPLEDAVGDETLDVALRIRVLEYLNRDRVLLDGNRILRTRAAVEDYVIRARCREDTPFEVFAERYNRVLETNRIPFDPDLYMTDAVLPTRLNNVVNSRFCLWKQGRVLRFYDVDAGDYTELYETLALEEYENTEVSTLKLLEAYPALMRKYDVRDQYELHNLLKKTADKDRYRDLEFQRQPMLKFGAFDRDAAIRNALAVLSPIAESELVRYLHEEYGYSENTLRMTYLKPFARYLADGVYDVAGLRMPPERKTRFLQSLTEDFYPVRRLAALYQSMFSDAQEGELNIRDLRDMGFRVYTEYALRNWASLEEYYTHILLGEEVTTLQDKLRRYSATSTFYTVYKRLKNRYDLFLCEPDLILSYRRLERLGVTREEIHQAADAAAQAVGAGEYFTLHLLRQRGFVSSLDRLGLEDFFLTEILTEDPRFAWQRVFGTVVLCRTEETALFGIREFLFALLSEHVSVELDDFVSELQEVYGIAQPDVYKIVDLVRSDPDRFYYDEIMRTIYRDKSIYLAEFDD